MDKFLILLFYLQLVLAAIKIKELKVPQSVESGTIDDVILDCDFDSQDEDGIEVKWFYNGDFEQIYQWIPETNMPGQAIGKLKDNIDVNYKISNDRDTMYRALRIFNLSPDMSGNYTCKVSGYTSEDVVTKPMIIYEPAENGLDLDIINEESTITCSASGIYPRPNMTIYIANENGTDISIREDSDTFDFDEETQLFNVTSSLYYGSENLTDSFIYVCELNIPGTTYSLRREETHYLASVESNAQNEEDYLNLFNYLSTTESPFNYTQEYTEFETQIEDYVANVTDLTENDFKVEDSGSISISPIRQLIVPLIMLIIFNSIIRF